MENAIRNPLAPELSPFDRVVVFKITKKIVRL